MATGSVAKKSALYGQVAQVVFQVPGPPSYTPISPSRIWSVADHMRIAVAWPVVALDVQLNVAAILRRSVPAYVSHGPLVHDGIVAGAAKLAGIALEDNNVSRRYPGALETGDHFE